MNISKYFWDLNKKALSETKDILSEPRHPKFFARITALLSRCDKPKELFTVIPKKEFMEIWPKIRSYWKKRAPDSNFIDWWETIYEQILEESQQKYKKIRGESPDLFKRLGRMVKESRLNKGLSQKKLALSIGMKQPDVSGIEEGKKNITLYTLIRLCKVLEIRRIDIQ